MINNALIVLAALIFAMSMSKGNVLYRLLGLFVAFSLIAIITFKDSSHVLLIIMVGLMINVLLALSHKGYRSK